MLRFVLLLLVLALFVMSGCRQKDIRETKLFIPAMTQENLPTLLSKIKQMGVVEGSVQADLASRTIVLQYDSMMLGVKNFEVPLLEGGFEVNGIKPGWRPR